MNIKNERAERLVRRLASRTGESLTTAITVAVSERLERLEATHPTHAPQTRDRLRRIATDAGPRWDNELRAREHADLLYDDRGLPR